MLLGTWRKWQLMPEWREQWSERETRLQLRLLEAEIENIRSLAPTLERLLLITTVEDLIAGLSDDDEPGAVGRQSQVRRLRDDVDTELTRSILDEME